MNNLTTLLTALKNKINTDHTEFKNNVHVLHSEDQFLLVSNFLFPGVGIIYKGSELSPQSKVGYDLWNHSVDVYIYQAVYNVAKTVIGFGESTGLISLCNSLRDSIADHIFTGVVPGIASARSLRVYDTRGFVVNNLFIGMIGFNVLYKEFYTT